jgi:methyl acetate hydrolase
MKECMFTFTRREFGGAILALGGSATKLAASSTSIDETLRTGIATRNIPAVAAAAATATETFYSGAFGKRDGSSGMDVRPDSIFAIASMTKAITTTAAMQLVERGIIQLDEPASKHLPVLAQARVLHGYDASGQPMLRPPKKPITLRHLLTHTSGFAYDTWNQDMFEYVQKMGDNVPAGMPAPLTPLVFEPGARWQYGTSVDWAGRVVEAISGQNLEQYFQAHILQPLGMKDTTYIMTASKFDRLVSLYQKQPDGTMKESPRHLPDPPKSYGGGGGLYSTPSDYVRFMQMILNRGRTAQVRILETKTVDLMATNQIGELGAGRLKSYNPQRSADVDLHPGAVDKWGLGFLINVKAYDNGRSAGSLAWAGIDNTFYWIDPKRGICASIMMQFLPFVDKQAVGLLGDFERSVYANLPG